MESVATTHLNASADQSDLDLLPTLQCQVLRPFPVISGQLHQQDLNNIIKIASMIRLIFQFFLC